MLLYFNDDLINLIKSCIENNDCDIYNADHVVFSMDSMKFEAERNFRELEIYICANGTTEIFCVCDSEGIMFITSCDSDDMPMVGEDFSDYTKLDAKAVRGNKTCHYNKELAPYIEGLS